MAYSWKISFDGHVLWKRMPMAPCALAMLGRATLAAAPAAATFTKRRRVDVLFLVGVFMTLLPDLSLVDDSIEFADLVIE
jgi:hypothetical protein